MLRRITLVILAALFMFAGGAVGAGGSVFEVVDEDGDRVVRGEESVQPGQVLTAHTSFSPNIAGLGGIDDGPYVVYLNPGSTYVRPGSVPPTAITLGQLEIVRKRFSTVARITFTVPSVPTGEYTMSLCNDPCTVDGLGDIVGGWLRITQTTKEGRLIARLVDVKRDRSALNHAVKEADVQAQELRSSSEEAARAIEGLRGDVADLETQLRAAREASSQAGPLIEWWAAALGALVLLPLAIAILLRGRSGRSGPPGTNDIASRTRSSRGSDPVEEPTPLVFIDR
jgi:hypothetical protein